MDTTLPTTTDEHTNRRSTTRLFRLALAIGLLTVIAGGGVIAWAATHAPLITDYQSCTKSGRPILDSYPAQCVAPNGRHFTAPTPETFPSQPSVTAIPPQSSPQPSATIAPSVTPTGFSVPPTTPIATPFTTATPLPTSATSGIYGTATISPTCPGAQRPGEICSKPYQGTFIVTSANSATPYTDFTTDATGQFSLVLPPGQYSITRAGTGTYPAMAPVTVLVSLNQVVKTDLSLDTGMR